MEKTVKIDGKEIKLRSDAAIGLLYEASFGVGYEQDFKKAEETSSTLFFYRMLWALAKTADESIPELNKWLKGFETIEFDELAEEVTTLFVSSIMSKKKFQQHIKKATKK